MPIYKREMVHEGRFLKLVRVQDETGEDPIAYEGVEKAGAVHVVAVTGNGEILLVKQRRPVIAHKRPLYMQETYELPAGHIDPGETPIQAAIREMREETGYRPCGIRDLTPSLFSSPGFTDETAMFFLATELSWDPLPGDPHEKIEVVRFEPEKLGYFVKTGKICCVKTLTGILLAQTPCLD